MENNSIMDGSNWILIILFLLIFGFNGTGFGRGELNQYATSASQQEILFGQQFQNLNSAINKVGDGLCSSTYALNNAIVGEGRNIQTQISGATLDNQKNVDALRYDMATQFAATNANTTAQMQKVLDTIAQDKIASLQAQVTELKTQNMFCGVPKISPYMYNVVPNCGCGCNNV